ncbi:MAG: hypothetical protein V3V13_12120 [Paracoccaceae bacterium]
MKIDVELKPLERSRRYYQVKNVVYRRSHLDLFGWYTWLVFGLIITYYFTKILFQIIFVENYYQEMTIYDWGIFIWIAVFVPGFLKKFRNWVLSKGVTTDPISKLVDGYNSGIMTVELLDDSLILHLPKIIEKISWEVVSIVFEKNNQFYVVLGHIPLTVLPVTDEIRAFFISKGYLETQAVGGGL